MVAIDLVLRKLLETTHATINLGLASPQNPSSFYIYSWNRHYSNRIRFSQVRNDNPQVFFTNEVLFIILWRSQNRFETTAILENQKHTKCLRFQPTSMLSILWHRVPLIYDISRQFANWSGRKWSSTWIFWAFHQNAIINVKKATMWDAYCALTYRWHR